MTKSFRDKWVAPFYMTLLANADEQTIKTLARASKEIDLTTTTKLLGYFDWRPKITAAYFSAINNYIELEDIIGCYLLKSEVCDAGAGYCLALAIFKTPKAKDYLKEYLEYYLQRKDLWFDQADAFCALEYIDIQAASEFLDKWQEFIADKPTGT